jgi:hypothetical protein
VVEGQEELNQGSTHKHRRQSPLLHRSGILLLLSLLMLAFVGRQSLGTTAVPGIIETVVGSGNGDGGPATGAQVDPRGVAVCYSATGARTLYM